jgi:2-oxoglutarate dehydrogenase complex dehydrogenase (E1) component-like enzyme
MATARDDDAMNALDAIARANPHYVESLSQQYRRDPRSVEPHWALVFAGHDLAGGPTAPEASARPAALSYDHRLVDGEHAVTFLVRVKERLEDPVRMLLEA